MTAARITKEYFVTEDGEKIMFNPPLDEIPDIQRFNEWLENIEDAIVSPLTFEESISDD
jgi:hypothetical protein